MHRDDSQDPRKVTAMTDNILKIKERRRTKTASRSAKGDAALRPGFGRVRAPVHRVGKAAASTTSRARRIVLGQKRAAVVTALPQNDLGWLVGDPHHAGRVDMSHVIWRDHDGIGRTTRASGSTSPRRGSASARRSAAPTAVIPPHRRSSPRIQLGEALRRRRACAGSTPAAHLRGARQRTVGMP